MAERQREFEKDRYMGAQALAPPVDVQVGGHRTVSHRLTGWWWCCGGSVVGWWVLLCGWFAGWPRQWDVQVLLLLYVRVCVWWWGGRG